MKRVVVLTAVALVVGAVVAQAASASPVLELVYQNPPLFETVPAANGEAINLVTEGIKLTSANGTVTCPLSETEGKLKKNFQATDKLEITKGVSGSSCTDEGWEFPCIVFQAGEKCGPTSVSLFPKKVMTLGLGAKENLKTKQNPATLKGSLTYPAVVRLDVEEFATGMHKVCEFTVKLKGFFRLAGYPVVATFEKASVANRSPASAFCPAQANMSIEFIPRTSFFRLYYGFAVP